MDQISDFFASEAHNSPLSFWAKLGYSQIEIDHIAVSLLKLQIEIGVHFINDELLQLPTPAHGYCDLAHAYSDLAHAYSDLAHTYSDLAHAYFPHKWRNFMKISTSQI